MASGPPRSATLKITGPLLRGDLPALFARTCALLEGGGVEVLRCELSGVLADAVAVDALARLALAARGFGCRAILCGASEELLELIALIGLAEVLCEDATRPGAAEARTAER
jgi:ABC-type transporter Mla MlaB component